MVIDFLKMLHIQIDFKLMNLKDWLKFRRMVKRSIREFYRHKKQDYFLCMCSDAEEIHGTLVEMMVIYPNLTDRFVTIHNKKLKDPMSGYSSGKYDALKVLEILGPLKEDA